MIDSLKDLEDIYEVIKTSIDRCREPKAELIKIDAFLEVLLADPTILNEKVDKDYKRYFADEFTQGLLKRLIREKSNDEQYLQAIANILQNYMRLYLRSLKDQSFSPLFLESTKSLFEFDNMFHSYHFQISEQDIRAVRLQGQTWRDDLNEGYLVDLIQEEIPRCSGWSQGKVILSTMELIKIQYLKENTQDKILDKKSLDLAPFESKTQQLFAWKESLKVGDLVDAFDKQTWSKSTILDLKDVELSDGRTSRMAYVAFRYYCEKGSRSDEKGTYDGYSNKYDDWICIYSPRIQPFNTKTARSTQYFDDFNDIDDELDYQFQPEEGMQRVFAVPRLKKCCSKVFLKMMNEFGNQGGFEVIESIVTKISGDCQSQEELHAICTLIEMISKPYLMYSKDFIKDYFPRMIKLARLSIKNAPDKFIRDINREKVDHLVRAIDNMQKRLLTRDEREKETEVLKLDMSLTCLRSGYLERRIQGIKDLNQLIKNNRIMSSKTIPNAFLVQWLKENDVFPLLFDARRTHEQIVQRLTDILKLLLNENELDQQLFEMFWNLSKSDYKLEVYKILNDVAYYLKKEHFDFILSQIVNISLGADRLSIDDYACLNEMSKYAKEETFKVSVNKFFWDMISKFDQDKNSALTVAVLNFIRTHKIQIYRPIAVMPPAVSPQDMESGNQQIDTSSSPLKEQDPYQETNDNKEKAIVDSVIYNLQKYIQQVKESLQQQSNPQQLISSESRKKLFLVNMKYSHHDEIDERLQFIKYVSGFQSTYRITKVELGLIYEQLVKQSPIPSDQEEFLVWCKNLCENSSMSNQTLDLNEVGEFFTEKMQNKELDVKNLPSVGFEFLQHYFLSINERNQKLIKSQPKQHKQSRFVNNYNFSGGYNNNKHQHKHDDEDSKKPIFKIISSPFILDQMEIVWNVALQSQNPKVIAKAITFLIKVHFQLDEDMNKQKCLIQDQLIQKCMDLLRGANEEFICNRLIEIIKHIIYEAEAKGTGDVQPHNAVLKGELLERIQIKYRASHHKNSVILSVFSNTTVWEFKKEVAKQFDLAPKYLKLERFNGQTLNDLDNGKTLAQLGMNSYESLNAWKLNIEEEIANAPLIGQNGKLSERALQIFNEWFTMYSDDTDGMTKETCALFIKGCTGEHPMVNDDRIQALFNQYDSNKDGRIEREDFLKFYETAARGKPDTVRENLKAHNIRNDLKKLSDVQEETSFKSEDMPRFKISENQEYFELLMSLLDRHDTVAQTSWDLIQMLATNRTLYTRVLQLKTAIDETTNKVDWTKFFDSQSDYKLLYTLQIVEAVMEEGEGSNLERIMIIDDQPNAVNGNVVVNKNAPPAPPGKVATPGDGITGEEAKVEQVIQEVKVTEKIVTKKNYSIIEDSEYQKLKSEWTSMFLMNDGIQYILKVFMNKQITQTTTGSQSSFSASFQLKHIAFLLKLLRIFVMAAFSTSNESQVYQAASQVRKSSSVHENMVMGGDPEEQSVQQQQDNSEGSRFKELQTLLVGPLGEEIIQQIDYKSLQLKILTIVSQILQKQEMIFEDKLIIENALSLWVGCVIHKNELFNDFLQFKDSNQDSDSFILSGLLYCQVEKVREEFKVALSSVAIKLATSNIKEDITNPLRYLLKLLSSNITKISQHHSKQYFDLFCQVIEYNFLLRSYSSMSPQKIEFNPESLLVNLIDMIKEYNTVAQELNEKEAQGSSVADEDNQNEQMKDSELETVYIGLIQLTSKIIENFDIQYTAQIVQEKMLIEEIFVKFLFSSVFKDGSQQKEIKIQPKKQRKSQKKQTFGKKSKDAAYKLINSLIKKTPILMHSFMEKSMIPLMNIIRRPEVWNYSNSSNSQGSAVAGGYGGQQKYVGLRNLGCICYMNSMLQQFFMIPAFRYNLLCVDDQTAEDVKEYRGKQIDDNMLHQLQKLMAHLELSDRSDYNPFEFCFSFKELDGQPTNTGEQKDAQEFLNLAFDRIENLLKKTSRKYLLQSLFGGQTCSQIVCKECGKVKNRIEDFYNLSLTVKDIKSMHESLQKLVEGEVISDYNCEGCGKKVDVSKRTLISQTPNVLIVHLQRITFNFDTFRNDKINTYFEFPYQLDLKPYSFYEIMRKEKRIKGQNDNEEEEQEDSAQQQQEEEKKDEEDNQWPEEENCFEYKLVGTTVHSGTANAGHYWSYINTKRGYLEPDENDPNWHRTENEQWMEFNDSRVTDFNFEKLKDECYGDQKTVGGSQHEDSWSSFGSYGKSAYMLIYERRKKRPIKIVVSKEEAEEKKDEVLYDEKREEHFKLIDYREGVEDIAPNQIYKQVYDDNKKYEFDNDIYSNEFFDFVRSILQAALSLTQDAQQLSSSDPQFQETMKKVSQQVLHIGKKTVLEILSKCFYNAQIKNIVDILIEIMKINDDLCFEFMRQCYEEDHFEYLMVVMLECPDAIARLNVCILMKFILTKLKIREQHYLNDYIQEEVTVALANDTVIKKVVQTPKAMTSKFMVNCMDNLNLLVAKNWSKFEYFLEVIQCFGCGDPEVYKSLNVSEEEQSHLEHLGFEFLFQHQFIGKACDFLLGRKSPLATHNEKRYEMGGAYSNPNFSAIMKLITRMINDQTMIEQYPLQDYEKRMILQHDLLKVMLAQAQGSKQFGGFIANMCRDNLKLTKKVSKIFIKVINASGFDNMRGYLKALKPFLTLNDSLKQIRMEWIFGFRQVCTRKEYREPNLKYGLEVASKINDEAFTFVSPIINSNSEEALLSQLIKCRINQATFAINCLKEMLRLITKDDVIGRFVYQTGPHSFQYARYTDWIRPYLESQKAEIEKNNSYSYMKSKHDSIVKALNLLIGVEEKFKGYAMEEEEQLKNDAEIGAIREDWWAYENAEVINHYPPQIIVGRQNGDANVVQSVDDNEFVQVTISEQNNDWNYSNPTSLFNLSLPHIEYRTTMYQTISYSQHKRALYQNQQREIIKQQQKQEVFHEDEEERYSEDSGNPQSRGDAYSHSAGQISEEYKESMSASPKREETKEEMKEETKEVPREPEIKVRDWYENKKDGSVLLRVNILNKVQDTVKFRVTLQHEDESNVNVLLPQSFMTDILFINENKCLGHFQKIDPRKPWTKVKVVIEAQKKVYGAYNQGGVNRGTGRKNSMFNLLSIEIKINVVDASGAVRVADTGAAAGMALGQMQAQCMKCNTYQNAGNIKCIECKEMLLAGSTYDPQNSILENYYGA